MRTKATTGKRCAHCSLVAGYAAVSCAAWLWRISSGSALPDFSLSRDKPDADHSVDFRITEQ